jgi:NADPH2:quinone reductase
MRAAVLHEEGDADVLKVEDVPVPTPQPGEVRIAIHCSALNHLDIWIRNGMPSVPKPRIMGGDGMGIIESVGEGVADRVGERVLVDPSITCGACRFCLSGDTVMCNAFHVVGEHMDGTHAEYLCVPSENALPVPGHLDDEEAAALPLVYSTAWRMLFTRAQLRTDEHVLVWGASGGVGTAALQLASRAGATVIATTRSGDKVQELRELGAHHVIDTSTTDPVSAVTEIVGKAGVEVVIDHLGDVAWAASMKLLGKGGRFVTCGATTGANPPAQITRMFWKQLTIMGSTMASKSDVADLLAFVSEHAIAPRVDRTFPLEEIADAHRHLESASQIGKVVLRVNG